MIRNKRTAAEIKTDINEKVEDIVSSSEKLKQLKDSIKNIRLRRFRNQKPSLNILHQTFYTNVSAQKMMYCTNSNQNIEEAKTKRSAIEKKTRLEKLLLSKRWEIHKQAKCLMQKQLIRFNIQKKRALFWQMLIVNSSFISSYKKNFVAK